jgi:hypothetical protein
MPKATRGVLSIALLVGALVAAGVEPQPVRIELRPLKTKP